MTTPSSAFGTFSPEAGEKGHFTRSINDRQTTNAYHAIQLAIPNVSTINGARLPRRKPPGRSVAGGTRHSAAGADFVAGCRAAPDIGLIAEVKKASPSAGVIRGGISTRSISTKIYQSAGASCLSVLTMEHFFQGHLDYLKKSAKPQACRCCGRILSINRYQVLKWNGGGPGADRVLLIAECLDDCTLRDLYFYAANLA